MSDFGEGRTLIGRKDYRCEACYAKIPKGEPHYNYRGTYGGDWQNWRMHSECYEAYEQDGFEEFISGDYPVPERIRQLYTQCES